MLSAFKRAQKECVPVAQSDPYQQESSSTLQSLESFFSGKLQKKLVELDMLVWLPCTMVTYGLQAPQSGNSQRSLRISVSRIQT